MKTVNNVYLLLIVFLSPLCAISEEYQVMKSTREPSVKNKNLEDNNMNKNNMVHLEIKNLIPLDDNNMMKNKIVYLENKNLIPLEDNNMNKNNMVHLEDTQDRRLLMMAVVGD